MKAAIAVCGRRLFSEYRRTRCPPAVSNHFAAIPACRYHPTALAHACGRSGGRARHCSANPANQSLPSVVIVSELVEYAVWWNERGGVDADRSLIEAALLDIVEKVFEVAAPHRETAVDLDSGLAMLEDISVDAPCEEFCEFLRRQKHETQGHEQNEVSENDGPSVELDAFLEWAQGKLSGSSDIVEFCEKRGARVEVVNAAAKITGANGVCVALISLKDWNPRSGHWKQIITVVFQMGLRASIEDSERKEWCKSCSRDLGFQLPEEIASCHSTRSMCRRLEATAWKLKL